MKKFHKFVNKMNGSTSNLCRFCLKIVIEQDFEIIEDVIRDTLNNFSLKAILTKDDMICRSCSEHTTDFLNFRSTCLYVEDKINDLVNSKGLSKLYLTDIRFEEKVDKAVVDLSNGETVCRFCLSLDVGSFNKLHGANEKETIFITNMIKKHIPEVNLSFTREPGACEYCYNFLDHFFIFIKDCLHKWNSINYHSEDNLKSSASDVTLTELVNIKIKEKGFENDNFLTREIKKEMYTNIEPQNTDVKIKEEIGSNEYDVGSDVISTLCIKKEVDEMQLQTDQYVRLLSGNPEDSACDTLEKETPNSNSLAHDASQRKYKCNICDFRTARSYTLKMHSLIHEDPSRVKMLKCEACEFTTKWKCSLKMHMMTHKNPSEMKMHKCNLCDYKTRYGYTLKIHKATHLDPSERLSYKCQLCTFKTTRKYNLKVHNLEHENPAGIKIIWCDKCEFKTKWKRSITGHMLTHKSDAEVKIYKCDLCSLKTRHSSALKRHMVTHSAPANSPSEGSSTLNNTI